LMQQQGRGAMLEPELIERVISIKRVSKVMKGGKRMRLSASVVVGDGKGLVGLGHGKAAEVAVAVRKATTRARKDMVRVSIAGHTIPHETNGKYGASRVLVKPAARYRSDCLSAGKGGAGSGRALRRALEVTGFAQRLQHGPGDDCRATAVTNY
jgi:ribosomal protein S5